VVDERAFRNGVVRLRYAPLNRIVGGARGLV
jgi:hypothetical protein